MIKGCGPMFIKRLEKLIKKFQETGSHQMKYGKDIIPIPSTSVEDMVTVLQDDTCGGVKMCSI